MLVLSRKVNERILVGDSIRITVISTRGGLVRLGIEAPDLIPIFREELCPGGVCPATREPHVEPSILEPADPAKG